jgi:transposase
MALTGNQRDAAAQAIARGMNVKKAAKETGVGERTLHRWLKKDPAFQRRVEEFREEFFSQARGRLSELAGEAAEELGNMLRSADFKLRLQVIRVILENNVKFNEMNKLLSQVSELERRLEEGNGTCAGSPND